MNDILDIYGQDIGYAYNQMLKELIKLLFDADIYPDVAISNTGGIRLIPYDDVSKEALKSESVLTITGRCGGRCGAAIKRAKTKIVIREAEKLTHLDMTGEILSKLSKLVIGRGVNRSARAKFATPGRTASDKSTMLTEHSDLIEDWISSTKDLVNQFEEGALLIKAGIAYQWDQQWTEAKLKAKNEVKESGI